MLVLLAIMSPLTRCAEGAYGDFFDSATCKQAGFSGLAGPWPLGARSALCHHWAVHRKAVLDSREALQTHSCPSACKMGHM